MRQTVAVGIRLKAKDIHPSEMAPVVAVDDNDLCCRWKRWDFLSFSGKQLIKKENRWALVYR